MSLTVEPLVSQTGQHKGAKVVAECRNCQRPFVTLRRQASRPNRGLFCSRPCVRSHTARAQHAARPQVGDRNRNWKGGVSTDGMRYVRRFQAKSPEKVTAQRLFAAAVRKGLIVRPESCSQCGVLCKAHAHHADYTQPYAVQWLCQPCHNRHHAAMRKAS